MHWACDAPTLPEHFPCIDLREIYLCDPAGAAEAAFLLENPPSSLPPAPLRSDRRSADPRDH
eukprot:498009-Pyramimonas_sp.AAC.1